MELENHPRVNSIEMRSTGGILRYLAFPAIVIFVLATSYFSYAPGKEQLLTPLIFFAVFAIAFALERAYPFMPAWNRNWRENRQDGIFFLIAQPVLAIAKALALSLGVSLATHLSSSFAHTLWPTSAHIALQVILALLVHDFLPYWYHRLSHQSSAWLWHIHAIHHAPTRMYSLNFVRFHPINSFVSSFLMLLPLVALGVPGPVIFMVAIIGKTHSMLSHTNFDFRLGPLNWIFSMAELHRWHHARDMRLANANYAATMIFWDILFGTRHLPQEDIRQTELGIVNQASVPKSLWDQLCLRRPQSLR